MRCWEYTDNYFAFLLSPFLTRLHERLAVASIKHQANKWFRKLMLDLDEDINHNLGNVHSDLASRITEIHEMLQGHITGNTVNDAAATSSEIVPRAPDYLEAKFEFAIRSANPELQDDKKFPLATGINAFHHHFEEVRYAL